MKRLLILLATILIFTMSIVLIPAPGTDTTNDYGCTDTDEGKNYYTQGHLEDPIHGNASYDDYCLESGTSGPIVSEGNVLREHYCGETSYGYEYYECPNKCLNGACIEEEPDSNVESITLEADGNKISWETNGESTSGFKVTWSKNENPTYPTREGDKYHYHSDSNKNEDTLTAFNGEGKYYVRVCEYLGGKCGIYSNEIELELGQEESQKLPYPYIMIKPSEISTGDNIEIYFENNLNSEARISQVLIIDTENKHVYGSGPINKNISSKEKELIFTWNQEGNSGDYNNIQAPEGEYFAKIKYSHQENNSDIIEKQFFIENNKEEEKEEEEEKEDNNSSEKEPTPCNGCLLNEICYPLGHRINGTFCANDLNLTKQFGEEVKCENNFECESNVCVSGECISAGFIRKIIDWFKRFF